MYLKKIMFAATLLLAVGGYAQNVKLVLSVGQKFEVTSNTKVNSVSSIMGQEMETAANKTTVELYEVKKISATQSELVSTITRMVVNSTAMGQEINFDSDKKDNSGPGAEEMSKLVNKPRNIIIDTNGKILKDDKSEADIAGMMPGAGAQAGISILSVAIIGKTIKSGDSWLDSTIMKGDKLNTHTVGTYTVKSIDNNIANLAFAGTSTLNGTIEQMGQEMAMNSTSKVTGETKLDINTGIIMETSNLTDGNMTIEAAGMSIPVTTKTSVTTKVKML